MSKQHEIEAAYFQGLREANGADPEIMEDLGIPMSPETMDLQLKSARHIAHIIGESGALPKRDTRSEWIDSQHLTHPSTDYPQVPYKTADQKAVHTANVNKLRSNIKPTKFNKD